MKVTETTGSDSKTTSRIDLEIDHLPKDVQNDIKEEVGEYLVEATLLALGEASSPVSGERFPKLSKDYQKKKVAQGGSSSPDLEVSGALKDAIDYRATSEGIELGVFGSEAAKADGHNKFSGRENYTPQRRFLPGEGQTFKQDIVRQVEQIIADHSGSAIQKSDLSGVESKEELYEALGEFYPDMSKAAIKAAVAGNSDLLDLLIELDLLEYL